ncbi:hypothetical protein PoB_004544100 [Plakobranchus ocellatus]|uniref:Uncharacterized protein n=1 Tax=Plakobranchus ocellatus TaxID=259542 RepID=A0AAV4BEU9_9GAST|nr:hypothetical protein PoB_004544100 [Plakobranchus ocellatus]
MVRGSTQTLDAPQLAPCLEFSRGEQVALSLTMACGQPKCAKSSTNLQGRVERRNISLGGSEGRCPADAGAGVRDSSNIPPYCCR